MKDDCGFDDVHIDAVGNVVGVYHGSDPAARLLTGRHDTVRNGGSTTGAWHPVPMVCVRAHCAGGGLPFGSSGRLCRGGQPKRPVSLGRDRISTLRGSSSATPTASSMRRDARRMGSASTETIPARSAIRPLPRVRRGRTSWAGASTNSTCRSASRPRSTATRATSARGRRSEPRHIDADGPPSMTPATRLQISRCSSRSARAAVPHLVATDGHAGGAVTADERRPGRCSQPRHPPRRPTRVRDACTPTCSPVPKRICERRGLHYKPSAMRAARCAQRAPEGGALGAWPSPSLTGLPDPPDAQRRRPRRDEAARGDAVVAMPFLACVAATGHQRQPARGDQRRHRAVRARVPEPPRNNSPRKPRQHYFLTKNFDA